MGCAFEVRTLGVDVEAMEAAAEAALDEVARIDALLSWFAQTSEVYRLNHTPVDEPVQVDVELMRILEDCWGWNVITGGVFDPVASGSQRLQGSTSAGVTLPEALRLNPSERQAVWVSEGAALDLGGYGKGYALDRAYETLRIYGVRDGMIQGGGSSFLAWGTAPQGQAWRVRLAPDQLDASLVAHANQNEIQSRENSWILPVDGELGGLSFSGVDSTNLSELTLPGKSIPPLKSSKAPCRNCAVASASAVEAETLSTTFLILGRERSCQWLKDWGRELEAIPEVWWREGADPWERRRA
jgi:thiamine biosynthesis lipoprotein ApbE